jgi:hypothetical protein
MMIGINPGNKKQITNACACTTTKHYPCITVNLSYTVQKTPYFQVPRHSTIFPSQFIGTEFKTYKLNE